MSQNIFGDEVAPTPLRLRSYNDGNNIVLMRKHYLGQLAPNGWTGKSMLIDFPKGEPVLTLNNENISLTELKMLITEWERLHPNVESKPPPSNGSEHYDGGFGVSED